MNDLQLYIKDENGVFITYNDPNAYSGLGPGDWLISVKPGSTSARRTVEPNFAALSFALKHYEDYIVDRLHEASKLRPASTALTKREQKAWKLYEGVMGSQRPSMFLYQSLQGIVEEANKFIKEKMMEQLNK